MKRLPTDRQILRCIYEMYVSQYPGPTDARGGGENDPFVPINIRHVAGHLGCQPELVFGRIYYHLDAKHRYKQDNVIVSLFELNFRNRGHSIHFPYMASILATLDEDHHRHAWSIWVSVVALVLSSASIVAQVIASK